MPLGSWPALIVTMYWPGIGLAIAAAADSSSASSVKAATHSRRCAEAHMAGVRSRPRQRTPKPSPLVIRPMSFVSPM